MCGATGKQKVWGRFQKSRRFGKQLHEVYEFQGSPVSCACVDLILKSIPKYLRTKPKDGLFPRTQAENWGAYMWDRSEQHCEDLNMEFI